MSRTIIFRPSEEKMETYKSAQSTGFMNSIDTLKNELLCYCLKNDDKGPRNKQFFIYSSLQYMIYKVIEDERNIAYDRYKENDKGEISFNFYETFQGKEYILKNTTKSLLVLTDVVATPDYFDDYNKFIRKEEEIINIIDDFIDSMIDCAIEEIIKDLDEFKIEVSE